MKKLFCIICFVLLTGIKSFGQDYYLDSARIHAQGDPGDFFLASLPVTNNSGNTLTFYFERIVKNLPLNWNSCFCYPTCIAPWIDTLTFSIPPFSTDSIKPNFGTDSTPGIGYITIVLYLQEGQSFVPKDTIYFTGSTLSTSVDDAEEMYSTIYPNPAGDFLEIISPQFKIPVGITIYNLLGKEVLKSKITSQHTSVDIRMLTSGIYFLRDNSAMKKITFVKK